MTNWEPMYIRQVINRKPKDRITHIDWNSLWNLVIVQGDNNALGIYGAYNSLDVMSERIDGIDMDALTNLEIDDLLG